MRCGDFSRCSGRFFNDVDIADITMGFMAIVNIISIFLLGGTAIKALRNYEEQKEEGRPLQFKARDIGIDYTDIWK